MMSMSNFLAIATVTAVIKKNLQNTLVDSQDTDISGALVTTVRPDKLGNGSSERGVNIYLYMVTPNTALRNADMPNRSSEGKTVQRPQVALDLHYLLTFYGEDKVLEPQRLLGKIVCTLHTSPLLTRQIIRKAINDYSNDTTDLSFSFLKSSNLADSLETVKFTPASLSLEELSKLWSVFFQTPYRLSVAYTASVVLIESESTPQSALPVRERSVYVAPFHQPFIEAVLSLEGADKPIVTGSTLLIRGKKLRGDVTLVKVNGTEVKPESTGEMQLTLPLSSLPLSLSAGVHSLQVVHKMLLGKPPVPHNGTESNLAAFVLHPKITGQIQVSNREGEGNELRSADLTITVNPVVRKGQRVALLLNEISSGKAESYIFIEEPSKIDTNTITIHISGVKAADYLVRVQVDGAQSQLTTDTNENSKTFDQYIGPGVKIE